MAKYDWLGQLSEMAAAKSKPKPGEMIHLEQYDWGYWRGYADALALAKRELERAE